MDAVEVRLDLGDPGPRGQWLDKGHEPAGHAGERRRHRHEGEVGPPEARASRSGPEDPQVPRVVELVDAPVDREREAAHGDADQAREPPPPRLLGAVLGLGAVRAELALDVGVERVKVLGLESRHALEAGEGLAGLLEKKRKRKRLRGDGKEASRGVREANDVDDDDCCQQFLFSSLLFSSLLFFFSSAHSTTTSTTHLCRRRSPRRRRGHRAQGPQRRGELAPVGRVIVRGIEVVAVLIGIIFSVA